MLICDRIQNALSDGKLQKQENECIFMTAGEFRELFAKCKEECGEGWSKEYRQMDEEKVLENITEYMKMWMMIRQDGEMITILPSVGRITGYYPEDFKGGTKE